MEEGRAVASLAQAAATGRRPHAGRRRRPPCRGSWRGDGQGRGGEGGRGASYTGLAMEMERTTTGRRSAQPRAGLAGGLTLSSIFFRLDERGESLGECLTIPRGEGSESGGGVRKPAECRAVFARDSVS